MIGARLIFHTVVIASHLVDFESKPSERTKARSRWACDPSSRYEITTIRLARALSFNLAEQCGTEKIAYVASGQVIKMREPPVGQVQAALGIRQQWGSTVTLIA